MYNTLEKKKDLDRTIQDALKPVLERIEKLEADRNELIEQCAKVAEAQAETFLSPQYATNQPFGSICERFACEEVAKAIRALVIPRPHLETP